MALSRIAPYAETGDSLEKPGWWGRRFRLPTARARIKSWQEKAPAPPFFMKFRGRNAHPNRQRISGKLRRKFMSVPGLRPPPLSEQPESDQLQRVLLQTHGQCLDLARGSS